MRRFFFIAILLMLVLSISGCSIDVVSLFDPGAQNNPLHPATKSPTPITLVQITSKPNPTDRVPTTAATLNAPTLQPASTAISPTPRPPALYYVKSGESLASIAAHFGVKPSVIQSPNPIPQSTYITPGQLLIIPNQLVDTTTSDLLLPDSEVIFSPTAIDFDVADFVRKAGSYLISQKEWLSDGWNNGAQVVEHVARDFSINPRLLLALLEFKGHWVYSSPQNMAETDYPMGFIDVNSKGLYKQLCWAATQLTIGYYGWRDGTLLNLEFQDHTNRRLAPTLNAGSAALQYLFSKLYSAREWGGALYSPGNLIELHTKMFGNPWLRDQAIDPLFPAGLTQPKMALPFMVGRTWSLTSGPHNVWGDFTPLAALDLAPSSDRQGCYLSDDWVTASSAGLVTRSTNGLVVVDMDGDGHEQTGWVIIYLHVGTEDRVLAGTFVNVGSFIGHPSCEGGTATGNHVHIARKFNGEWIPADGPLPFVMSGWQAHAGAENRDGSLTCGDKVVTACACGSAETNITHTSDN